MAIELPKVQSTRRVTEEGYHRIEFTEDALLELLCYVGYPVDIDRVKLKFDELDKSLVVEWHDPVVVTTRVLP